MKSACDFGKVLQSLPIFYAPQQAKGQLILIIQEWKLPPIWFFDVSKRICGLLWLSHFHESSVCQPAPLGWVPPECWASASRADLPGCWWLWWMPGTHSPHTRYLTPTAGYSSAGCCTMANAVRRADMEHPLRQWTQRCMFSSDKMPQECG